MESGVIFCRWVTKASLLDYIYLPLFNALMEIEDVYGLSCTSLTSTHAVLYFLTQGLLATVAQWQLLEAVI